MPRPVTEVYRYYLRAHGDPSKVDLWLCEEDSGAMLFLAAKNLARPMGMALVALLNGVLVLKKNELQGTP